MVITCERCATSFILADELVSSSGTPVQCTRCQHTFLAMRDGSLATDLLVTCPQCSTPFRLARALVPEGGASVRCMHCDHAFRASRPTTVEGRAAGFPPVPPNAAPGPLPRRNVMLFGQPPADVNALPDPTQPPAESYRSAVGRITFGERPAPRTDHVMFFGPPAPAPSIAVPAESRTLFFGAGPAAEVLVTCPQCSKQYLVKRDRVPPDGVVVLQCTACGRTFQGAPAPGTGNLGDTKKPVAPTAPVDELERMLAHAADHLDDEQSLLVLSDALMERGDPRGRLIAFMLEEERQTDLMRKVKVNVLTRDHAEQWAPPGARITGFHRGLPADLEWSGPTDPHHLAWRSARSLHVTLERVPKASVLDVLRPNLRRVTGLNRAFFTHVAAIAPASPEAIDGHVHTDELLTDAARTLTRMPRLQFATLRSTQQLFDARLGEQHLQSFLEAAGRSALKGVRLSMPQLPASVLDRCLSVAPRLNVHFVIPFEDFSGRPITLGVDPRRRLFVTPAEMFVDYRLRQVCEDVSAMLGEPLSIVQATADR